MSILRFFPTQNNYYTWFFYLGVIFFLNHLFLFGFGINLSYFGLLLMFIGIYKPVLHNWFFYFLVMFICFDIYANVTALQKRFFPGFTTSNTKIVSKKIKEGNTAPKKTTKSTKK